MLDINVEDIPEASFYVYMIENITGKKYIGLTSNIKARLRQYRYEYNTDNEVRRNGASIAMKEEGIENFTIKIIHVSDDVQEAMKLEELYIRQYDTIDPDKGYNLSDKSLGVIKFNPRRQTKEEILRRSKKVYLIEMGVPLPFTSAKELADYLNLSRNNVTRAAKNGNTVRGRLVVYDDPDLLTDSYNRVRHRLESGKFKKPEDIKIKERFLGYCLLLRDRSVEVILKGSTE